MNGKDIIKIIIMSLSIGFPLLANSQESYKYELIAGYIEGDVDGGLESSLLIVGGSIYLSPVLYGDYPYMLTDFFNRVPRLEIFAADIDYDFKNSADSVDGSLQSIGYEYANSQSPLAVGVNYSTIDSDGTLNGNDAESGLDELAISAKYYFDTYSAIRFEFTDTNSDFRIGSISSEEDGSELKIEYQNVISLDSGKFLDVIPGIRRIDGDGEKNTEISIQGFYFFNKRINVGVELTSNSGDDAFDEGMEVSLSTLMFFNKKAGVEIEYSRFSADAGNNDSDSISLALAVRI